MARIWFSLKEQHLVDPDSEGMLWRIGVSRIKKGAPVQVSFQLDSSGEEEKPLIEQSFAFRGVLLSSIKLESFVLPAECTKDDLGNIFCPRTNAFFTFFFQNQLNHYLQGQMEFCPLCGRRLAKWPELPESKFADWVEPAETGKTQSVP